MSSLKELKERIWRCNLELPQHNLVLYTFGNVSGIDREAGVIVIKPSGVLYEELAAGDMVVVDLDGNVVEGSHKPSSDTKTHIVLYKAFPGIGGIVHTHSTYATAWAQARQPIPCMGTTHADYIYGDIPCTTTLTEGQIKGDYEVETGNQIVKLFADLSYKEVEMVLVASHGPFTWGMTPEKAVSNSVVLEELAKMAHITRLINPETERIEQNLLDKHYRRKHGSNAYYGQD